MNSVHGGEKNGIRFAAQAKYMNPKAVHVARKMIDTSTD
jgi:hypothetical protein